MNTEELKRFIDADKHVHPVELQWHYPILTKYGYVPITKTGIGFVRRYTYENPVTKRTILVATGASSDYWEDGDDYGYWRALEPHLEKLVTKENQ